MTATALRDRPDLARPSTPTGVFGRLGGLLARRARLVVALSAVFLLASSVLGVGVFGRLLGAGYDDPSSPSSQAKVLLDQRFGGQPDLVFLVHARSGTVDTPVVAASGRALAHRLAAEPTLRMVASYWTTPGPALRSRDGTDGLVLARVAGNDEQAGKSASALIKRYAHVDDAATTVRIGGPRGTDAGGQVGKDLALAESIAVPVTLVLLVVAFGSAVAALLPLIVSFLAILGAFAALDLVTHVTRVSVFAINLTTALGLGLGIDYALLMVARYREELSAGADVASAVARTVSTAGRTIAFSALTVAAALSALLVFPMYFLRSFAYAGVTVVVLAALAALITMPAALALLGPRINAGRLPWARRSSALGASESARWARIAATVTRRPALAALPVLGVLLFAATPLLSVTFGTPDDRVLPVRAPSHQVGDALRTGFAANATSTIDVIATPALGSAALSAYTERLRTMPGVVGADRSRVDGSDLIRLTTSLDPASNAAQGLVRQVRASASAVPRTSGVLVGGTTATLVDAKHSIGASLPLAAAIIVVTTLLVLFGFTGSIIQPIRALLGNALTLGATLGTMVWIFQDGHLSSILGFTPTPTDTSSPVLLFCIAFGLSMDYEVFLMSRIKELHDGGATTSDAVRFGLSRTGRIVSTAAGLLAVSFFAFGTSKVSFIQLFGLGTGMAILLDATLVRGVLVPASMQALGERSWWAPAPLRRFHRVLGLSER